MIRQELNQSEQNDYFWTKKLQKEFGEHVSIFDVHNWGEDSGTEVMTEIKNKSK